MDLEIGFRRLCVHTSCVCSGCSPLLWSALMCDTDQQCQSPLAVTPVPPKACKTPHISHITSLKSFILPSVLCDLTQWLFMPRDPACVCASTRARSYAQGQVKSGLCYMITGLSLFSLHTSASLFWASMPSFNTDEISALLLCANCNLLDVAHM